MSDLDIRKLERLVQIEPTKDNFVALIAAKTRTSNLDFELDNLFISLFGTIGHHAALELVNYVALRLEPKQKRQYGRFFLLEADWEKRRARFWGNTEPGPPFLLVTLDPWTFNNTAIVRILEPRYWPPLLSADVSVALSWLYRTASEADRDTLGYYHSNWLVDKAKFMVLNIGCTANAVPWAVVSDTILVDIGSNKNIEKYYKKHKNELNALVHHTPLEELPKYGKSSIEKLFFKWSKDLDLHV